jgi:NADH-quinone oxidoreductase subunit C
LSAAALDRIAERLAPLAAAIAPSHGLLVAELAPPALLDAVKVLKEACGFDLLLDVTAVDWPGREPRFDVVWHFYSTRDFVRVRLRTRVPEDDPTVDSLAGLYGSARFAERECHDMYGIRFRGNADLRPILLYEGFVGHPLRKDYPKDREQPLIDFREP